MRRMKKAPFMLFNIIFILCGVVHSQNSDSCNNNINFNEEVDFDTTSLICQPVWNPQNFILRYAKTRTDLWSFLLSVPDINSWVGIGFSTNGMMIGSSAMVGWVTQTGSSNVTQYFLKDKNPNEVLPGQGELTVIENSTKAFKQSSRVYLAFQLSATQPRVRVLYAVGPTGRLPTATNGYKLTQHSNEISTSMNWNTGTTEAQSSPYTGLRRTHGALNMLGWGILMPIGALAARYFRQWDPIWFYAHAAIQVFAFLFGLVAFILGFVLEGFINADVDSHKAIGIIILVLGCLQVMALLARPQKGSKVRKYWNWYHHNAGRILLIFVISNIFYGIHLGSEGSSWYGSYAAILAILVIAAVVLEIRLRKQT